MFVVTAFCWLALTGGVFAQAPGAPAKAAPPDAGLKAEAKKPTFYRFALDERIEVHERAVPVNFGGSVFSPLEVREVEFKFDEKDNRLTGVVSCAVVRALDAVRTVHVALFDGNQRLLGTASVPATITKFVVNNMPASEPMELALDFGESAAYKLCKSFQVSISGRGRSDAKFGMKDADELFTRLANVGSPQAQRDAANALAELGAPVLPRLKAVAAKENRTGRLALEAIAKMGTPEAVAALAEQLKSPDITDARRMDLYDLLSSMGPPAYEPLSREFTRPTDEGLEIALVRMLPTLNDPRVGPFLIECFKDDKKYIGRVRAEIAVALVKCQERAAVPLLIAALRDSSGSVRMAAAYAVEQLTNASVPIEWNGSSTEAWMNAPPESREVAVKRWEEWWKTNEAKFGVR
jgi:HEAT repeat protein